MLDEFYHGRRVSEDRVRELIGHTPFEVFVGAAMGFAAGFLFGR